MNSIEKNNEGWLSHLNDVHTAFILSGLALVLVHINMNRTEFVFKTLIRGSRIAMLYIYILKDSVIINTDDSDNIYVEYDFSKGIDYNYQKLLNTIQDIKININEINNQRVLKNNLSMSVYGSSIYTLLFFVSILISTY